MFHRRRRRRSWPCRGGPCRLQGKFPRCIRTRHEKRLLRKGSSGPGGSLLAGLFDRQDARPSLPNDAPHLPRRDIQHGEDLLFRQAAISEQVTCNNATASGQHPWRSVSENQWRWGTWDGGNGGPVGKLVLVEAEATAVKGPAGFQKREGLIAELFHHFVVDI